MEMINLLPTNDQNQLAAARTNTLLLRYTILLGVFVVILLIEILGVFVLMNVGKAQNQATIADNDAKASKFAPVKAQADSFRTNLATAKYVLDKQVPYTPLMLAIAQNLPNGAVLNKLSIDPATFGTPTTLTVDTASYTAAIQVKTSLQNTKLNDVPLFSSVSFQSVSASDSKAANPYTAIYTVTYSKAVLKQ